MRLSKIKLAGFKSFVDSTEFLMPSNLIGVVGPNGCGKSNIIDAVRWVMGETSAKMLRGANMTDVIFSGSSARKPVGSAMVELIFDNSDGSVTGEFAKYNEISVKRQVSRDGQSSYYLNKTKCRKKDITDLFLGTGLGPRSYAIIEQGMISRVVESKPEELRSYIEEAAGISKYRERRRETERRISHTRENLDRLDDLRAEVGKHINHLQRQAKNAERYKKLKQQHRQVEAELLSLKWSEWSQKTVSSKDLVAQLDLALEEVKSSLTGNETQIDKQRIAHHVLQDKSNKVQEKLYQVNTQIGKIEQFIAHTKSLSQRLQNELQDADKALAESQTQLQKDQQQISDLQKQLEESHPQLEEAEQHLANKQEAFATFEDELLEWQSAWNQLLAEVAEKTRIVEVEQTKIATIDQQLARQADRLKLLKQESSDSVALPLEEELQVLEIKLEELETRQQEHIESLQQSKQTIEDKKQELQSQQEQFNQLQSQLHQAKGRRGSLVALQEAAMSEDNPDVQKWFAQNDLKEAKKLAQLIEVDSGWESAVEAALGQNLQALVPEKINNIQQSLESWKFGHLNVIEKQIGTIKPTTGSLSEVVKGPDVIYEWFNSIFITKDLATALSERDSLNIGQSRITKDGIMIGKNWIQTIKGRQEGSFLLRKKELQELNQGIEELEYTIENLSESIQNGKRKLQNLEQNRDFQQSNVNNGHRKVSEMNASVSSKKHKIEQIKQRNIQINTETEQLQVQIEIDEVSVKKARAQLEEAIAVLTELQEQKQSQQQQQTQISAAKQQSKTELDDASSMFYQKKLQIQGLESRLNSSQHGIERLQQHCQTLEQRKVDLMRQLNDDSSPLENKQQELENLLDQRLETEKNRDELRQQTQSAQAELEQLERQRNDHNASIEHARTKLENARLQHQSHEMKAGAYDEQIREKGFEAEDILKSLEDDQTPDSKTADMERLQRSITRLEPVNLAAISEYEEESERKEYLDKQNDDLVEALETLEKAIRKIDRETRTLFKDTFEEINSNIKILFPKLFGGGHCYLELTSDDLLTTGVTIMARPPGKRVSNIQLLSGGEKALTAVAMVFAIFNLNPAPFCMLDEVDAPLDDANVARFSNMVKEMSDKVQFLFVTHNKVTMEIANQLNGVTMREPGVSRLVSVDLAEAERMIND